MTRWPLPWPLWLTSLATMTLLMTVWRKSFSPATLGEKREMFSCLWRMASSNASLEFTRDRQHTNGKRRRVATESERSVNMSRREMDDREREKENTKRVIQIPWQGHKAMLLANSCVGWVTGETQRDHLRTQSSVSPKQQKRVTLMCLTQTKTPILKKHVTPNTRPLK